MTLEFSLAVEQWVAQAGERSDAAFRAVAEDTLATVKELTPVRTGFLRANWTVVRNDDPIPMPGRVQDAASVIARLRIGDQMLIVNPVVYAPRVEFGFVGTNPQGHHVDQKGAAMMQRTLTQLPEIARRAVERVAKGSNS